MFIEAKDDGGGGDNWTTGAISRAKFQSNHHHQQTNIQFFYRPDALPVAQPTVSKHWRENITSMVLLTPSLPGGLPTLSLTTNSSWLPWGRFAMPVISPLMPVPHAEIYMWLYILIFWGIGIMGLSRVLAALPTVTRSLQWSKTRLEDPQTMECDTFYPQCFDSVGWVMQRASGL